MSAMNDYALAQHYANAAQVAAAANSSSSTAAGAYVPPPPPPPTTQVRDFVVDKNAADFLHSHFNSRMKQDNAQYEQYYSSLYPSAAPMDDYYAAVPKQQYAASGYYSDPAFAYGYDWFTGGEQQIAFQAQQQQQQQQMYYATHYQQQQQQQQQPMKPYEDSGDIRHVSPPLSTKRIGSSGEGEVATKKRSRGTKRAAPSSSTTTTTAPAQDLSADGSGVVPLRSFPVSIHGETRLNIKFISMGEPGVIVQRFGKHNCSIPHGLSGTHQMYDQRWKFEVLHVVQGPTVLIRFNVTNLSSGTVTSVTETIQDAMVRETCGRTICNNVLKNALELRAVELENSVELVEGSNPTRAANIRNLIKVLRPKRCTVGLLFFGLLHESVQTNHERMVLARSGIQVELPSEGAAAAPASS